MPDTHRGEQTGDNHSNNRQLIWQQMNPSYPEGFTLGSWNRRIPRGNKNDKESYEATVRPTGGRFEVTVSHVSQFHKRSGNIKEVRRPLTDEAAGPSPEGFQGDKPKAPTFRTYDRALNYAQAVMNNDLRGEKAKPVLTATRQAFRRNRKNIASLPETEE